jgi:hypothetical protein
MIIELLTTKVLAAADDPKAQYESDSNPWPRTVTSAPPRAEPKLGTIEEMLTGLTTSISERITRDRLL